MSQRDRGGAAPRDPTGRDRETVDESAAAAGRDLAPPRPRPTGFGRAAEGDDIDRGATRRPSSDTGDRPVESRDGGRRDAGSPDDRNRAPGIRDVGGQIERDLDRQPSERRVTFGSTAVGGTANQPLPPIRSAPARDPYADPYSDMDEPAAPPRDGAAARPRRRATTRDARDDDPTNARAWLEAEDEWTDDAPPEAAPVPVAAPARRRSSRGASGRPAPARARPRVAPTIPSVRVPAFLARADLATDRVALGLLGAALLGLVAMALVLGSQLGRLPDGLVVHLDAAGIPDRWGAPRILWRLPLLAVAATLMNLAVAWFLAPLDRFASRFVLAAALVVQLLAWVAVFDFIRG